jgi:hypothetical protein
VQKRQIDVGKEDEPMATEDGDADFVFYPAYCFKVSLTHFAWVKMTIADVHRLKPRMGFEGR